MCTDEGGCRLGVLTHSLRAICTVLLDPRDPLLHSERTQGFTVDPDYWKGEVFVYVGRNQNLKDLKDLEVRRMPCFSPSTRVQDNKSRIR